MANNSLLSLKTKENTELKPILLNEVIETSSELAGIYTEGKNISFEIENTPSIRIMADAEKLTAVLINLVKNAVEAFDVTENIENYPKNGKYIRIKTEKEGDFAVIMVSNNAPGIREPEKIFNENFTTKSTGSGFFASLCAR